MGAGITTRYVPDARVERVVVVKFQRGRGVAPDPIRIVTAYYSLDGELLAENDPHVDTKEAP